MSCSEYDLYFESRDSYDYYQQLVQCKCTMCPMVCQTMSALNRHCNQVHQMFYCDLCLRHARLLPHEFILMSRSQLVEHRRWTNNKGHPLCEFCDLRLYEFDDLIVHVRQNHFFCDICQRQRIHIFFKTQSELIDHYSCEHFMCTECSHRDHGYAFQSELELKSHRLREHTAGLQRSVVHDRAQLELDIQYNSGGSVGPGGRFRRDRDRIGGRHAACPESSQQHSQNDQPTVYQENPEDFPTLGASFSVAGRATPPTTRSGSYKAQAANSETTTSATSESVPAVPRASWNLAPTSSFREEDFPQLFPSSTQNPQPGPQSVSWTARSRKAAGNSAVAAAVTSSSQRGPSNSEDFPSLPGSSVSGAGPPSWKLHVPSTPVNLYSTGSAASKQQTVSAPSSTQQPSDVKSKKNKKAQRNTHGGPIDDEKPFDESQSDDRYHYTRQSVSVVQQADEKPTMSTNGAIPRSEDFPSLTSTVKTNSGAKIPSRYSQIDPTDVPVKQFSLLSTKERKKPSSQRVQPPTAPILSASDDFPALSSTVPAKQFTGAKLSTKYAELSPVEPSDVSINQVNLLASKKSKKQKASVPKIASNSDFPELSSSLGGDQKSKSPPPVFKNKPTSAAKMAKPPSVSLRGISNSLNKATFSQPVDFDVRNAALIQVLQQRLSPNQFTEFVTLASQYRNGQIDSPQFRSGFDEVLPDHADQLACLPEMVSLLPDIALQRNVLDTLPNYLRSELRECGECGQICRTGKDYHDHLVTHQ